MRKHVRHLSLLVIGCVLPLRAWSAEKPVNFSHEVLPVFSDRCFHCHGPDGSHRQAKLRLDVEANANDSAYQLWQGMLAFGVGGLEGVGLGMGRQQMYFLPEAHTDFIFPVIGEELGLIATFTILVAFLIMFFTVGMKLRQISRMNDYLLAMGALLFIVLQAIINMGVVTGCLPTKGMSLPFISYGGSNLVVTFIFVGLVINVMRRKDNPSPIQAREL